MINCLNKAMAFMALVCKWRIIVDPIFYSFNNSAKAGVILELPASTTTRVWSHGSPSLSWRPKGQAECALLPSGMGIR
ncbi:hypothetical protein PTI98_011858 [Pleurotus ostreatus]|nr:hypothetical protein PTI98_011858 [Pleurotus ostreatus]